MIKFLTRRSFSSKAVADDKLSKAFNQMPWNFNAHLMMREIGEMEAPVDLGSSLMNKTQATTLFKEFVAGMYEGDLSDIQDRMEPKMYQLAHQKVDQAHDILKKQGLTLKAQTMRGGPKLHQTEFFLYDVKNYVLMGDVSMDRRENKPETDFHL